MMFERRSLIRCFVAYIGLIIPVLFLSILAIESVFSRMLKVEEHAIKNRLDNVIEDFESDFIDYENDSIVLSEKLELLPHKMTGTMEDIAKGIEVLKLKRFFDSRVSDIFIDYGTGSVFSSKGM